MPTQPRILIVGGSLTGPALGLFLQQYGIEATIIEAVPPTISQAGGVIGLGHVALTALERAGVPQGEYVTVTNEKVNITMVADRQVASRTTTTYPGRTATWTTLHRALMQKLQQPVVDGYRVKSIHTLGAELEIDGSAKGTGATRWSRQEQADLVIFADGRNSTGRRLVDPARQLHYAGYVAYRGMASGCPPELQNHFTRLQPRGTQFTTFPMDGQTSLDWTFYVDTTPGLFRDMFNAEPTQKMFVLPNEIPQSARDFVNQKAQELLPDLEARVVHNTKIRMAAPVVDIDPPCRLVFPQNNGTNVILLGDALAPVRPHTARGANNGIEQADDLASVLYQHTRYGANLASALDEFQKRHLPRVLRDIEAGPPFGVKLGLGQGNQRPPASPVDM